MRLLKIENRDINLEMNMKLKRPVLASCFIPHPSSFTKLASPSGSEVHQGGFWYVREEHESRRASDVRQCNQ